MFITFGLLSLISAQWLVDLVFAGETTDTVDYQRSWLRLIRHSLWHGLVFFVLYGDWSAWALAVWIGLTHLLVDYLQTRIASRDLRWFIADQTVHLALSYAGALLLMRTDLPGLGAGWLAVIGGQALVLQLILAGSLAVSYVGAEIVGGLVAPLRPQFEPRHDRPASAPGDRSDRADRGFPEGGRLIGMLERSLIFILVLIGQTAAIGFLVAAKSIFRFGELRQRANRLEAEYILIGTLASFLWGLAVAALINYLLSLF